VCFLSRPLLFSAKPLTSACLFCIILLDKKVAKRLFLITYFYSYMNKLINYIKASISEMKKVTWPTKKETYNYTILVISLSLIVAVFLGALDYIFNFGFKFII